MAYITARYKKLAVMSRRGILSVYSKLFVLLVFLGFAVTFWANTGLLYWEYSDDWREPVFEGALWFDLMTHHSHLFLFFPLFGTVALAAFFLPAAVFVDMYWRRPESELDRIPFARLRFVGWFAVLIAASLAIAYGFNLGDERGLWQLSPNALRGADNAGVTSRCAVTNASTGLCERVSYPVALANVRRVSQARERLTDLTRACNRDPLIEQIKGPERRRFCFVTTPYSRDAAALEPELLNDQACCQAMERFEASVRYLHLASPDNRSRVDRFQAWALPINIFFLLVILVISVLLAFRRDQIARRYLEHAHRIDRGVLIGTAAMLFLPFMNHAYLLSMELLYGPNQPLIDQGGVSFYRVPYGLSVLFGIWGFFIMLFFIRREDKEAERTSKIIGTIASGVFVLKYDTFIDYAVRFAGPGAGTQSVIGLAVIAASMLILLMVLKVCWREQDGEA